MKRFPRTLQSLLILLVVFFFMIALSAGKFAAITKTDADFGAAAFFVQSTPTPQIKDVSEIGSTDGIVLMGVIIAMIVVVPILLRHKSWSDQ